MSRDESTGISADTEQMIASQYGEETAHAISVLGNGFAQGGISPTQAIKTASGDPALQRAQFSLAQKGLTLIDTDEARPVNNEWSGPAPRIGNSAPKVSQPNIRAADGSSVPTQRVTAPNMSKHLAEYETRKRQQEPQQEELKAERDELSGVIDPRLLNDTLQALDRKVRKLERENRELKKKVDVGQA